MEQANLADVTAALAQHDAAAKAVDSFLANQVFHIRAVGKQDLDAQTITLLRSRDSSVEFREEPAGVEGEDGRPRIYACKQVRDDLIFDGEAACLREVALREG
jgi:hypothetical protein